MSPRWRGPGLFFLHNAFRFHGGRAHARLVHLVADDEAHRGGRGFLPLGYSAVGRDDWARHLARPAMLDTLRSTPALRLLVSAHVEDIRVPREDATVLNGAFSLYSHTRLIGAARHSDGGCITTRADLLKAVPIARLPAARRHINRCLCAGRAYRTRRSQASGALHACVVARSRSRMADSLLASAPPSVSCVARVAALLSETRRPRLVVSCSVLEHRI